MTLPKESDMQLKAMLFERVKSLNGTVRLSEENGRTRGTVRLGDVGYIAGGFAATAKFTHAGTTREVCLALLRSLA